MTAKPTNRRRRQARLPRPRTARASFSPSRNSRPVATTATANSANRSWSISTARKMPPSETFRFSFQHYRSHFMKINTQQRGPLIWAISLVAVGFGLLTIKEGGMTLIGNKAAVSAAGNYVPFVLWFNFMAGFAYVVAGIGLWLQQRWAVWLAIAIAAATALVFAAFCVHVAIGGLYEKRTVIAMSMRTLVWATIAAIAWHRLLRRQA